MAARHEEGRYQKIVSICFIVCKGLSIDDVGASRDTVFQEIRPGVGFETGDFAEEKLGGATVERLSRDTGQRWVDCPFVSLCLSIRHPCVLILALPTYDCFK